MKQRTSYVIVTESSFKRFSSIVTRPWWARVMYDTLKDARYDCEHANKAAGKTVYHVAKQVTRYTLVKENA